MKCERVMGPRGGRRRKGKIEAEIENEAVGVRRDAFFPFFWLFSPSEYDVTDSYGNPLGILG